MFSSVSLNQSFLKESTLALSQKLKSVEDSCSDFKVGNDLLLTAKCQGKPHWIRLNSCVSYKESTLQSFEPNLQLKEDCKDFKIKKLTRKDGAHKLILQATCEDKMEKVGHNVAIIPLDLFLFFGEDDKLKCKDLAEDYIKKEPHELIDKNCKTLEIHNSAIFSGICEVGKKIFQEEIRFTSCIDSKILHQITFGFDKDCKLCSGVKAFGIHLVSCTCRDKDGRTKKNFEPLHKFVKLEGEKLQCLYPTKDKDVSKSKQISESQKLNLRHIPTGSKIEVLNEDKKTFKDIAEDGKKKKEIVAIIKTNPKDGDTLSKPIVDPPKVIIIGRKDVSPPVSSPSKAKIDNDHKKKLNEEIRKKVKIAEEKKIDKENIAKENIAKEKIAKENIAKEKIAKENIVETPWQEI